ncbi:MAG: hypothetical protein ACOYL6_12395 [Bacteriovoracaceae bacterium]
MYTKTFEADSLEEALKAVKFELGPDAVILKTTTNNGLKGAFKKKKIEITAAIPERVYEKKAKVDNVLTQDQKEQFYRGSATQIADSIDSFNNQGQSGVPGYGAMGLNRVVQKTTNKLKSSLDDFLSEEEENYTESSEFDDYVPPTKKSRPTSKAPRTQEAFMARDVYQETHTPAQPVARSQAPASPVITTAQAYAEDNIAPKRNALPSQEERDLKREVQVQQNKISALEERLKTLTDIVTNKKNQEVIGLHSLRSTLKTLDLSEQFITHLIKRAVFELSKDDLEDPDRVFDFALREIENSINVAGPLFSETKTNGEPVVTVLISESASGQSSIVTKMAALKKECTIIQVGASEGNGINESLALKMYKINIVKVNSLTELITECRKCVETKRSVFVDFRNNNTQSDETVKFIEGMRRSFSHVEVLITISAIHSELYNRKVIRKFKDLAQGMVISHLDLCLNYGSLLNVHLNLSERNTPGNSASKHKGGLPLKFFGTGSVIPDDIEPASPERIIAGMFQL